MAWLPKTTVIVPIDFSGMSVEAVSTALEMVDDPGAVHVIHIVVPVGNVSPDLDWVPMDDASREQAVRDHFEDFLKEHNFTNVTTAVRTGDPGFEITKYAEETNADLVIVPSHGYHGIKRLLLGSVAERVIRHAHCPVLILRRPDAQ